MDTQILIALITSISGIVSAVLVALITRPGKNSRTVFIVIGLLLGIGVGYIITSLLARNPSCESGNQQQVQITSPITGKAVSDTTIVEGRVCGSIDREIWLFIKPAGITEYYPQPPGKIQPFGGRWSASAGIGIDGDSGREFSIVIALVDQSAAENLRKYINDIPQKGEIGLSLPPGVERQDEVVVVRQ